MSLSCISFWHSASGVVFVLGFFAPLFAQTDCEPPPALKTAVSMDPSSEIHNAIGGYFAERQESDCAISAFEKSIKLDGENWESRFNLGLAFANIGKPRQAVNHLKIATRLRPRFLQAKLVLGFTFLELSDWAAAEISIREVLQLQPQSSQALYGLAQIRMQQRRYANAITHLERALEIAHITMFLPCNC